MKDDIVSITFLVFLVGMLIILQIIILVSTPLLLAFIAGVIVAEALWTILMLLTIRSIRVKLKDKKDKTDANIFLSGIHGGEFDDDAWFVTISCPKCDTPLTTKNFSSERAGHLWKMKFCYKCNEVVAKRLIMTVDIEPEDFMTVDIEPEDEEFNGVIDRLAID